jgi:hypothetical protein
MLILPIPFITVLYNSSCHLIILFLKLGSKYIELRGLRSMEYVVGERVVS